MLSGCGDFDVETVCVAPTCVPEWARVRGWLGNMYVMLTIRFWAALYFAGEITVACVSSYQVNENVRLLCRMCILVPTGPEAIQHDKYALAYPDRWAWSKT